MPPLHADTEACVRAVRSRDARFDGWFVTAVTTTGIYCRPSCPVAPPKPENMRFHPTAASAQQAGYRACKRCRPDATPGSPEWSVRADATARAMRLVADGVVDREGVAGLAARLGYSERHVERMLRAEVGAGPLALARAQRAQTARVLVETTDVPMADVAFAAGFASIRSFNATVAEVFACTPSELRRRVGGHRARRAARADGPGGPARPGASTWHHVALRLPFRRPLHPDSLFGHLVETRAPGVEEWRAGAYRRVLTLDHGPAVVALAPAVDHVATRVWLADLRDLASAVARCRHLLDLDADPVAVDDHLGADPRLGALVAAARGRRVPRTVDAGELALRVVLGQQVSTAAARTLARRLVLAHGTPVLDPEGGLTHAFPSAADVAGTDPERLAMPRARRRTLVALATALASGSVQLGPGADWQRARADLAALPGVGPWTVEMVAMRGLGDPDAFPEGDLGVRAGLASVGVDGVAGAHQARHLWRPWGAYAVQHLWATGEHAVNHLPTTDVTDPPVTSAHPRDAGAATDTAATDAATAPATDPATTDPAA